MKGLAVFLSFYILLLSAVPCPDVIAGAGHKTEFSQNSAGHDHDDADHCSPFCTCQCCQASCNISNAPVVSPSEVSGIIHYEYTFDFQSVDLFDFLIPPKV